ncbi:MAG: DUF72 domain-containing protein [Myxococcota bacterium]
MPKRATPSLPPPDPERLARANELAERAPLPARVHNIEFGTASWTDRTLVESGTFYPRGAKTPEARLRHYSAHFPFVEVDATYYSLLPVETAERWVSWTPSTFSFDIKAFPSLTGHPIDVRRLPNDLKQALVAAGHEARVYPDRLEPELLAELNARFLSFLEPLLRADRLRAVLLQFPPWFTATRGNVKRLEAIREAHPELPLAVEFRHASWFEPARRTRVFDTLRAQHMSFVVIDEPGMPLIAEVTHAPLALIRFHGKNESGWKTKGASVYERFGYLYEPSELEAWIEPVQRLATQAERVQAIFNNCARNYAVLGAKDLAVLLTPTEA